MTPTSLRLQIDNYLDAEYFERNLRADVTSGLSAAPKELPPKWFYDDRGSELFDQITRLEEYYPTEAERSILRSRASEIAAASKADTLVELGSGTADKTRVILDAMAKTDQLRRFVPFDVSEGILRSSSEELLGEYPDISIHGVVGDFERHLSEIPTEGTRMVALLGGTVGNFKPEGRNALLADLVSTMSAGDTFLLGTDLVKDTARLELAYDDPQGVTAEFNKNVLRVLNARLGANFDPNQFEHLSQFDTENEWIEMRLRSLSNQVVAIPELDMTVEFVEGEEMRTEISAKFRREGVESELAAVGLDLIEWWTDDRGDYALSLAILR